jgi:hypothetical protein
LSKPNGGPDSDRHVITDGNQNDPWVLRSIFLRGVIREARLQGYGVEEVGRLVVVSLRAFEESR